MRGLGYVVGMVGLGACASIRTPVSPWGRCDKEVGQILQAFSPLKPVQTSHSDRRHSITFERATATGVRTTYVDFTEAGFTCRVNRHEINTQRDAGE